MTMLNWPPSRGPKPPELEVTKETYEAPDRICRDIKFAMPRTHIEERKKIVELAMEVRRNELVSRKKAEHRISWAARLYRHPRLKSARRHFDFLLDHPVEPIADLELNKAVAVVRGMDRRSGFFGPSLPPRAVRVDLTYPLTIGVQLTIPPYDVTTEWGDGRELTDSRMDVGYVLWVVAREYVRIYENWRRYKVWGHELADLYFERLTVDGSRAKLEVVA